MTIQNDYAVAYPHKLDQVQNKPFVRPQELEDKPQVLSEKDTTKEDATRKAVVGLVGYNSYKNQFNAIMNGLLDQSLDDDTKNTIKTIQNTLNQNKVMQAYAYFQENPPKEPR